MWAATLFCCLADIQWVYVISTSSSAIVVMPSRGHVAPCACNAALIHVLKVIVMNIEVIALSSVACDVGCNRSHISHVGLCVEMDFCVDCSSLHFRLVVLLANKSKIGGAVLGIN